MLIVANRKNNLYCWKPDPINQLIMIFVALLRLFMCEYLRISSSWGLVGYIYTDLFNQSIYCTYNS